MFPHFQRINFKFLLYFDFLLRRKVFGFEQTYMYEILVTGPLCTTECAGECCFSVKLCKRALDVTADVIVEAICNADMLTINASEDFQKNSQSNMNVYKTHCEET